MVKFDPANGRLIEISPFFKSRDGSATSHLLPIVLTIPTSNRSTEGRSNRRRVNLPKRLGQPAEARLPLLVPRRETPSPDQTPLETTPFPGLDALSPASAPVRTRDQPIETVVRPRRACLRFGGGVRAGQNAKRAQRG